MLPPFPSSPASPTTFDPGITLRAIHSPVDMFTARFGVAPTVGWIAQWQEMIEDPEQRIGRCNSALSRLSKYDGDAPFVGNALGDRSRYLPGSLKAAIFL